MRCVPGAQGGQKRASDPLDLKVELVVNTTGFWEPNLEQQVFLTAGPPLQPFKPVSL